MSMEGAYRPSETLELHGDNKGNIKATEFSPGTNEDGTQHDVIEGLPRIGAEAENIKRNKEIRNRLDYVFNEVFPTEDSRGYKSYEEYLNGEGDEAGTAAMKAAIRKSNYDKAIKDGSGPEAATEIADQAAGEFEKLQQQLTKKRVKEQTNPFRSV